MESKSRPPVDRVKPWYILAYRNGLGRLCPTWGLLGQGHGLGLGLGKNRCVKVH